MKKIEAIIRPDKMEVLKAELDKVGYPGIMVSEIKGHGKQRGINHQFRGVEYKEYFISKVRIELIVPDSQVKKLVEAITEVCRSGAVGDGKIFVFPVDDAVRIRTGESGDLAL